MYKMNAMVAMPTRAFKMATDQEEYLERKRAAVQYLSDNQVPKCFQKLLNDVVLDRPDDIFGYMAEYFAGQSKPPVIANITSSDALSSRGYSSYQVEIEALVHGNNMILSTSNAPFDNKPPPEIKPLVKGKSPVADSKTSIEDKENCPENEDDQIQSIIKSINTCIRPLLVGTELYNEEEINKILEDIIAQRSTNGTDSSTTCIKKDVPIVTDIKTTLDDEALPNDEMEVEEENTELAVHLDILTVSMALIQSASQLQKCQLYRYLYKTVHKQEPSALTIPSPMLTLLRSRKVTAGKLYLFKDVMIFMRKNIPPMQALKQLIEIYQQLYLMIHQKPISNMIADNSALTPALDKPEQALDLIRDAISSAGYSYEDDVAVVINCAIKDIYDKEKQKYEISLNTLKSGEELVNVYVDLFERYPEIKFFIDPFLSHHREECSKLNERTGGNCFIMNQESFSNNPKVLRKLLKENLISGNVMKTEDTSTVTEFLQQSKTIEDCPRMLFIAPNEVETDDHFMVDMAVAVQADFVVFGGPERSENIRKYNRLQRIENDLKKLNILVEKQQLLPCPSTELKNDENAT